MNDGQIWSVIVTAVGIAGFILAGKKIWWAWWINVANQIMWMVYAQVANQPAFYVAALFYLVVFTKNAITWTKERHEKKWEPQEPIGVVNNITWDQYGIRVEGEIYDESLKKNLSTMETFTLYNPYLRPKPDPDYEMALEAMRDYAQADVEATEKMMKDPRINKFRGDIHE